MSSNRAVAVQARYEKFKIEYRLNGGNGTQAAIAAGYSPRTASVQASQLLKRLKVEEGANERTNESLEKSLLSQERVLKHLEDTLEFDPRRLFRPDGTMKSVHELDEATARALSSFDHDEINLGRGQSNGKGGKRIGTSYKVRWNDKLQAIDKAMRMFGLFERDNRQKADSIEISVNLVGAPGDEARPVVVEHGPQRTLERPTPLTVDEYNLQKKHALENRGPGTKS